MKKFLLVLFFTIFPVLAHGATYYIAKTGSDSNSCSDAQSQSKPKLTINAGAACLRASDTLLVKAGTYVETLDQKIASGVAGAPTTLKADTGEVVMIQPLASQVSGNSQPSILVIWGQNYITVDGLILDMTNSARTGWSGSFGGELSYGMTVRDAHHVTVQNTEIRNSPATEGGVFIENVGIAVNEDAHDCLFTNNHIHHIANGGKRVQGYAIYFKGTANIAEKNHLHHLAAYGFHIYNQNIVNIDLIVRENLIHDTGLAGILVGATANAKVYNNVIYNCSSQTFYGGIVLGFGGSGSRVYNNTVYGCNGAAILIRDGEQTGAIIRNNIGWQNGSDSVNNGGTDATIDHNLMGINPLFVNTANYDFH
jgi:hypothetical protein